VQEIRVSVRILLPELIYKVLVRLILRYRKIRYGYAFRMIRMSQPHYAKVDPADYERLQKYEWFVGKRKNNNSFYTQGFVTDSKTGKEKLVSMHREILKVPKGMLVDHINHDGMDNRSANLRKATHSQNMCNRKKFSCASSSKYKGVSWHKGKRKWEATIGLKGRNIHLGRFKSEIEAAKAYDAAAREYHGEFAYLNFPEKEFVVRRSYVVYRQLNPG